MSRLLLGLACVASLWITPAQAQSGLVAPENVAATEGGLREVTISWSVPRDGAARYRIERSTQPKSGFEAVIELAPSKATFTDHGVAEPLADGTAYYYRIVPLGKGGVQGPPSAVVKAVTAPAPAPPGGLKTETPKSRGVLVSWDASTAEGVTEYIVERTEASQPGDFAEIARVVDTSYMDGGTAASTLKDSTLYLYRIRTLNRVGSMGEPSEAAQVTTPSPPDPPRAVQAVSREVRCVPLSWQASPEQDVVRYDVYRAMAAAGPYEKVGEVPGRDQTSFLDGGRDPGSLEDDGQYFYRVRAINEVTAESADSATVNATTREVPPRVEGVRAEVGQPREVPLTWKRSPDEKVLGYEIWRAEGDGDYTQVGRVGGPHVTEFVDRDGSKQPPGISLLKDDTVYNYKIIAFNTAYARSSASDPVSSQTKPAPRPPVDLFATTNLPYAIDFSWAANTETAIVEYVVEASGDGRDFRRLQSVPVSKDYARVYARESGLNQGVPRFYRIRAIDKDRLTSDWSEIISGRSKPIPAVPRGLKQEATPAGIRLTWEPPDQPDIRYYKLYTKGGLLGGTEPYAVCERPEFTVEWPLLKSSFRLTVTAIDFANLESSKEAESIVVSPRPDER